MQEHVVVLNNTVMPQLLKELCFFQRFVPGLDVTTRRLLQDQFGSSRRKALVFLQLHQAGDALPALCELLDGFVRIHHRFRIYTRRILNLAPAARARRGTVSDKEATKPLFFESVGPPEY